MKFERRHLQLTDYSWTSSQIKDSGWEPTRNSFDAYNGNHVLTMINYFVKEMGSEKITENNVGKIEKLIRDLPENIKSEKSVLNFLRGHYLYPAY